MSNEEDSCGMDREEKSPLCDGREESPLARAAPAVERARCSQEIVWRNVILMTLLHIGAAYSLCLIPKARLLTLIWGESPLLLEVSVISLLPCREMPLCHGGRGRVGGGVLHVSGVQTWSIKCCISQSDGQVEGGKAPHQPLASPSIVLIIQDWARALEKVFLASPAACHYPQGRRQVKCSVFPHED